MNNMTRHSRRLRILVLAIIIVVSSLPVLSAAAGSLDQGARSPQYLSPRPGATLVSLSTTVAVRYDAQIDPASLSDALFDIKGALSGSHTGQVRLADDQRTIIFTPNDPFALGEEVTADVRSGMRSASNQSLDGVTFRFRISPQLPRQSEQQIRDIIREADTESAPNTPTAPASEVNSNFLTLPSNFPNYTLTVPANGVADGYLFAAPWSLGDPNPNSFLLVTDNTGQPVYYRPIVSDALAVDFKRQPNGLLTYYDFNLGYFLALDSSYNVVDFYDAGNGYNTDLHDLQILPNGHALLLSYDPQPVDMSLVVPSGSPTATVIGLVLQELDTSKNVVFEWRSWDHFNITDTVESLTTPVIDYVHGNAIDLDQDGNWLISSRHMNEVTKISRSTGDIIWRLGGKNNQFDFVNDPQEFSHQHDIRRLPNGNITLYDNHNSVAPTYSRAVEYQLDEINKTATEVWDYPSTPGPYSFAMGDAQRLSNGNTLIGWGIISAPALTEVKPDGSRALELEFAPPYVSYRAFRFPWQGFPSTDPTLVVTTQGSTTTLAYSWNGATEIASYRIYAGDSIYANMLITTQPKTGFEDRSMLVNRPSFYCYFRVMPIDKQGRETRYSNEAHVDGPCTSLKTYFPLIGW